MQPAKTVGSIPRIAFQLFGEPVLLQLNGDMLSSQQETQHCNSGHYDSKDDELIQRMIRKDDELLYEASSGNLQFLPADEDALHVHISGGGFPAFWYSLGYGSTMLRHRRAAVVEGLSAGAMVAALLICKIGVDEILNVALELRQSPNCRLGKLAKLVEEFMGRLLPSDAHLLANKQLGIILACPRLKLKGVCVRHWKTRMELIDCVVASCFIPGVSAWATRDPVFGCVDGGISTDIKAYLASATFNPQFLRIIDPKAKHRRAFATPSKEQALELFKEGSDHATIRFEQQSDRMNSNTGSESISKFWRSMNVKARPEQTTDDSDGDSNNGDVDSSNGDSSSADSAEICSGSLDETLFISRFI